MCNSPFDLIMLWTHESKGEISTCLEIFVTMSPTLHNTIKKEISNNYLFLSKAHSVLAAKVKWPQTLSTPACGYAQNLQDCKNFKSTIWLTMAFTNLSVTGDPSWMQNKESCSMIAKETSVVICCWSGILTQVAGGKQQAAKRLWHSSKLHHHVPNCWGKPVSHCTSEYTLSTKFCI